MRPPSSLTRRAEAQNPGRNTSRPTTSRDIMKQAESRLRAAILVDTLSRDAKIEEMRTGKLPSELLSPAELLSTEELLALDQATKREAYIEAQARKSYHSIATWLLSHTAFPADGASLEKLTTYCRDRGWNPGNDGVLNQAYEDLLASRQIVNNYTAANKARHEKNVDELRAVGYDIHPLPQAPQGDGPQHLAAWKEELEHHMAQQPHATMEQAFLIDETPERTYEAPHVPTLADFDNQ